MSQLEIIFIVLVILLVFMSALFSSIETAYSSCNRIRLKNYANDGNKKAKHVLHVLDNFDLFISTILVGNNIVNIVATTLSTLLFTNFFGETKGPTISTIVITLVILTFGEISPKSIAKRIPEQWALKTVNLVRFFIFIFKPLTIFFKGIRTFFDHVINIKEEASDISDELMTMVSEAQHEGSLDPQESDLISAAIEFHDLDAYDILTHRVDVVAIEIDKSLDEIEEIFRLHSFSRLPVYEDSIDHIIGIIHEKDFYRLYFTRKGSLKSIIQPTLFASYHVKISNLLKQLQSSKSHMAIILDEYGGTAGIVTLEDILEELVGDIYDEHDTVKEYYTFVAEDVYLVSCDIELEDMFERFNIYYDEDEHDYVTVSGWVINQLNKIPKIGDTFTYENLEVLVTNADERKVLEIKVTIHPKTEIED